MWTIVPVETLMHIRSLDQKEYLQCIAKGRKAYVEPPSLNRCEMYLTCIGWKKVLGCKDKDERGDEQREDAQYNQGRVSIPAQGHENGDVHADLVIELRRRRRRSTPVHGQNRTQCRRRVAR